MSPLAVGPVLAIIGIVAAFFVLRGKAKTRKSMYRTLRERREYDLRKARERATSAKGAAEKAAMERDEAAAQAAAAAAAPGPAPASTATIFNKEASAAPPSAPEYTPEAPAEPPPTPLYTPQEPTYTPPEPTPMPVEPLPVEVLPEPPATAGNAKPAWEIVQPQKPEAEDIHAATEDAASSGKASWELDPREQQRIDDQYKGRGWHEDEEEDENVGEETLAQVLLSYAGLVVALLVILLGILFMIGAKATN
jgi:hypothetical protein